MRLWGFPPCSESSFLRSRRRVSDPSKSEVSSELGEYLFCNPRRSVLAVRSMLALEPSMNLP